MLNKNTETDDRFLFIRQMLKQNKIDISFMN